MYPRWLHRPQQTRAFRVGRCEPPGSTPAPDRLLRNGEVLATDAVDFEVIGGKTIRASVVGYDCDSTKWQFIINKIDGGPSAAPSRIHVTWDNGAEEDVPLSNASGKTARYVTTSNLDAKVTEAAAFIYEKWNGKFNLGQGPC